MEDEFVSTSAPEGLVPNAIMYEGKLLCDAKESCVVPVVRRRKFSRSNYQSGVHVDNSFTGNLPGRDFVTGVAQPFSNVTMVGF